MNQSFFQMGLGIGFAVLLVYFLMVVNFQSWTDPLIILMALPGRWPGFCGRCSSRGRRSACRR